MFFNQYEVLIDALYAYKIKMNIRVLYIMECLFYHDINHALLDWPDAAALLHNLFECMLVLQLPEGLSGHFTPGYL